MQTFNNEQKTGNDIKVTVVVCTYNRAESFRIFLDSFFAQDGRFPDCELLFVDNNSTDCTKEVCEEYLNNEMIQVRYINEKKQGLSNARNAAVKNARGELLAFIDDDVEVDKNWLSMIYKLCNEFTDYAVIGGKIVPLWEKGKPNWVNFSGEYPIIQSVFPSHDHGDDVRPYPIKTQKNPIGANFIVRKKAFKKYGYFREDLGVSGSTNKSVGLCEDTEFTWRLLAEKEKALYYPKAIVSHPVPVNRSTKTYIRNWYFRLGGSLTRIKHGYYDKQEYNRFLGIPRWMFKKFINPAFWLLFSTGKEKRFFYNLQFYRLMGTIAEFFNHRYELLKGKKEK